MEIFQLIILLVVIALVYFLLTFALGLIIANVPRDQVDERPDWGITKDCRVPTTNGKTMECWVVYPEKLTGETDERVLKENPAVLSVHGWGRNRGRMVSRARIYGRKGYTTILFSARDHGNSDKELTGMSIVRFCQDLEDCLEWWGHPVIVTGHSIGAGAALIVAARNSLVTAVIAEAPPHAVPQSLKYIYRPVFRWLTPILLPGIIIFTLVKFVKYSKEEYSPLHASSRVKVPTLLIHGKNDELFPYEHTIQLGKRLPNCRVWIPDETSHYDIEKHPDYVKQVIDFIESIL